MEAIRKTPPSSHKSEPTTHLIKSHSRLAQMTNINSDFGSETEAQEIPHFSVEFAPSPTSSTKKRTPSTTPSKLTVRPTRSNCIPLHELLLLSPPVRKSSRTRLPVDRLEMADDSAELRRRSKARTSSNGLFICGSPRNLRRSRRRIETEEREREFVVVEDVAKPRKRRTSGKSKKEKINSANSKEENGEESALDHMGQIVSDLVMWRDVAKSSLWFGFGCLCFLSSCFTKGVNISLFSVISQLGLLFLAASFISSTLQQRDNVTRTRELKLKEEDILRVIRIVLPALNLAISRTSQLFSGEPCMTLKVAMFFLFGAEYGHLLTLKRLCALGFFISFTVPKLYASYSAQIHSKVEQWRLRVFGTWEACSHKKAVALSAATAFWNLSGLRTRVFAAFISLVILRYYRQHTVHRLGKEETVAVQEEVQLPDTEAAEEELEKESEQKPAAAEIKEGSEIK